MNVRQCNIFLSDQKKCVCACVVVHYLPYSPDVRLVQPDGWSERQDLLFSPPLHLQHTCTHIQSWNMEWKVIWKHINWPYTVLKYNFRKVQIVILFVQSSSFFFLHTNCSKVQKNPGTSTCEIKQVFALLFLSPSFHIVCFIMDISCKGEVPKRLINYKQLYQFSEGTWSGKSVNHTALPN